MTNKTPLELLNTLDRLKRTAFLALFAGAKLKVPVFKRGSDGDVLPPVFGKAECDWVEDWLDFYGRELPALGLTTFEATDPQPALGMEAGSTYWHIVIGITDAGVEARRMYYDRLSRPE